jgi:hypothetical protein
MAEGKECVARDSKMYRCDDSEAVYWYYRVFTRYSSQTSVGLMYLKTVRGVWKNILEKRLPRKLKVN